MCFNYLYYLQIVLLTNKSQIVYKIIWNIVQIFIAEHSRTATHANSIL